MEKSPIVDFGFATNLAVIQKPGISETLIIVGRSQLDKRWARIITWGAAQTLWFRLTHILYPRAAQQITPRAATAAFRRSDAPAITSFLNVTAKEQERVIMIHGLGGQVEWKTHFSYDEGHELWAALERILDAV
ncbi:MAG: hypothetical protein JXB30_10605 [Anaerolineae bacterium]|nr:hypothetical protein [Anaerolineae bacterium]